MEKIQSYNENVITYKSKFNVYGNRLNLIVNHATKKFSYYSCNHGDFGTIKENLLQREIKAIKQDLINEGYESINQDLTMEFGYSNYQN